MARHTHTHTHTRAQPTRTKDIESNPTPKDRDRTDRTRGTKKTTTARCDAIERTDRTRATKKTTTAQSGGSACRGSQKKKETIKRSTQTSRTRVPARSREPPMPRRGAARGEARGEAAHGKRRRRAASSVRGREGTSGGASWQRPHAPLTPMYFPRAKGSSIFKIPSNVITTRSVLPLRFRRGFEHISNLDGGRPCDICSKP